MNQNMMDDNNNNLTGLPLELFDMILQNLGLRDMSILSQCNKQIHHIIVLDNYYKKCKELLEFTILYRSTKRLKYRHLYKSGLPLNDYEKCCVILGNANSQNNKYFFRFVQYYSNLIRLNEIFYNLCKHSDVNVINFVINHTTLSNYSMWCGMSCVCEYGNINCIELLSKKISATATDYHNVITYTIEFLCRTGKEEIVKTILRAYPHANVLADVPALSELSIEEKNDVMILFFQIVFGFDQPTQFAPAQFEQSKYYRYIFISACRKGNLNIAQKISHIVGLDDVEYIRRAFRDACQYGQIYVVPWLLSIYPRIISSDDIHYGITDALQYNHLEIAELLINNFLNIKSDIRSDISTKDVFYMACGRGYLRIVKFLWEYYEKERPNGDNLRAVFKTVCRQGYLDIAKFLLQVAPSLGNDTISETDFVFICSTGNLEMVQWVCDIFSVQFNIDQKETNLFSDNLEIIQHNSNILLEARFDEERFYEIRSNININQKGTNPFTIVCINGHTNIAIWLYQKYGPNICKKPIQNFEQVCMRGSLEFAEFLYTTFPEIKHNITNVYQLFCDVCCIGNLKMARFIFDKFTDICKKKLKESGDNGDTLNYFILIEKVTKQSHLRLARWLSAILLKEINIKCVVKYNTAGNLVIFRPEHWNVNTSIQL